MAHPVAETLRQAAQLNADDDRRRGNVVHLEDGSDVIATGDIHGNRSALKSIISFAAIGPESPTRLILQEIIHGPVDPRTGHDRSIEVLLRAARLKIAYPRQVVFLMGNHDVAEITGSEVTRAGQPSCRIFTAGVRFAFDDSADEIIDALGAFLFSLPLAVRCSNKVLISHSLPTPARLTEQCFDVLDRPYCLDDMRRGGGVYEWTWGRGQTEEMVADLARKMDIEFFILGHVHSPDGYVRVCPRVITLACDHGHGCIMRFPTDQPLDDASAEAAIMRVAGLTAPRAADFARHGRSDQ